MTDNFDDIINDPEAIAKIVAEYRKLRDAEIAKNNPPLKPRTPVDRLMWHWARLTKAERDEFLKRVGAR